MGATASHARLVMSHKDASDPGLNFDSLVFSILSWDFVHRQVLVGLDGAQAKEGEILFATST